jgi:uncharacterized protein
MVCTEVTFEWDIAKDRTNRKKHGIDFETADTVFDDPFHTSFKKAVIGGEERWLTIGSIGTGIVVVAYTYWQTLSEETIRIISAR